MRISRGIQRPGQTKEQTKLIAQGIQKGIDQYKRQFRTKERELDKKLKRVSRQQQLDDEVVPAISETENRRTNPLPWILLAISWMLFLIYVLLT